MMRCPKCSGQMYPTRYYAKTGEMCEFDECIQCSECNFHNGTLEVKRVRRLINKAERRADQVEMEMENWLLFLPMSYE